MSLPPINSQTVSFALQDGSQRSEGVVSRQNPTRQGIPSPPATRADAVELSAAAAGRAADAPTPAPGAHSNALTFAPPTSQPPVNGTTPLIDDGFIGFPPTNTPTPDGPNAPVPHPDAAPRPPLTNPTPVPATPDLETSPTPDQNTPAPTQHDLDRLLEAFGARSGQRGFDPSLDFNGDGVIDGADLANLLSKLQQPQASQPELTPQEKLDGLLKAFGQSTAESPHAAQFDLNGDGVVNGADLAQLLSQISSESSSPSKKHDAQPTVDLKSILSALGTRAGGDGYARHLDLTGDGQINGADLAAFLAGKLDED